jgi:RPA family protein
MMHEKDLAHTLVPTCRVFFDDFLKSDFILQETGTPCLVTPTGARCKKLFGVGEVTDLETRGNIARIKLNDLTATLSVYTNKTAPHLDRAITAHAEQNKTFIAFCGNVHVRAGTGKSRRIILLADDVGTVEERVRNGWILTTAWRTMERIEALRLNLPLEQKGLPKKRETKLSETAVLEQIMEHYALDSDKLDAFARTAINAVTCMLEQYHSTTKGMIMEQVKKAKKSGMNRENLMRALKTKGLQASWIEDIIDELIIDGKCYESESGTLKC